MNIKVDILLGFLGAGKTTLINLFLDSGEIEDEKVVIILYEEGRERILKTSKNVNIIRRKPADKFNKELLNFILRKYMPDRVIIEYGGKGEVKEFIDSFKEESINRVCRINKIVSLINARGFGIYFFNLKDKVKSYIKESDVVILNNSSGMNKIDIKKIKRYINKLNKGARILEFPDIVSVHKSVENRILCLNSFNENINKNEVILLAVGIVLFLTIIFYIPLFRGLAELVK